MKKMRARTLVGRQWVVSIWLALILSLSPLSAALAAPTSLMVGVHQNMRAFLFTPEGPGPHPGILLLHTSGGLKPPDMAFADRLANAGYIVLVPAFLEAYGITMQNRQASFTTDAEPIYADFIAALDTLRHVPGIAPDRLGAVGFSNGGYFAAWLAATGKVQAAISWYGALSGAGSDKSLSRFSAVFTKDSSPVLILHGTADDTVPVAAAQHLGTIIAAAGSPYAIQLYDGAGHEFDRTPDVGPDVAAATDAWQRSLDFLGKYLKPQ